MKFSRLVRESKLFWPSKIRIDDGKLHENGGGYFPTLTHAREVYGERQELINEWHRLMSWAIFCGLHKKACEKLRKGDLSPLKYAEIDFDYVEAEFFESLHTPYLRRQKQMRSQYRNDRNS